MTEHEHPRYRFRGNVKPSAEVARPVAAARNADSGSGDTKTTSATLDIFDVIDSWGGFWGISARDVDKALGEIGKVDTLYVRVNSPGGEALEGVAIGNMLRAHAATVRVTVYGLAASAASALAMAGDTVNMAPGSMMMIHDAWNIVLGNPAELRTEAAVLDKLCDGYAALYAKRAGGTVEQWRALMTAETWYTADDAVQAKLADAVAVDPAPQPVPASDETLADLLDQIGFDSAADRFDLSVFAHAPAAKATKTPADQPVTPPTDHKEADTMSDTIPTAGLVKALGLPDDADEDTILEAVEAKVTASASAKTEPAALDASAIKAALEADGKTVVSKNVLDELTAQAQAGAQARAKQLEEERDATIAKAFSDGKISGERRDAWKASWDKDPEGTKADLESLPARFPVGPTKGHQGDGDTASAEVMTDAQAEALAAQFGVSKEALTNA